MDNLESRMKLKEAIVSRMLVSRLTKRAKLAPRTVRNYLYGFTAVPRQRVEQAIVAAAREILAEYEEAARSARDKIKDMTS